MAVSNYFETLTDTDFAMDVGTVFIAFLAPTVASGIVTKYRGAPGPQELYGIVEILAAEAALSGSMKTNVQIGGGLYTFDKLAERAGIKGRIEEAL